MNIANTVVAIFQSLAHVRCGSEKHLLLGCASVLNIQTTQRCWRS